jgi:thiamine-phosphate pyrophosphorylase
MGTVAEERRERLARVRLYVITGERGDLEETLSIAEAALKGGADAIQLRKKTMPKDALARLALRIRELTRDYDSLFIVNDHPDLAITADADGVHLGQDDFPPAMMGRLLGRSTHSLEQAQRAVADGVDYLGVGPVFPTPTKPGRSAVGTRLVREVAENIELPFVAIGGIDLSNAPRVIEAGARALAVVRAVYDADDPASVAQRLRQLIDAKQEAWTT